MPVSTPTRGATSTSNSLPPRSGPPSGREVVTARGWRPCRAATSASTAAVSPALPSRRTTNAPRSKLAGPMTNGLAATRTVTPRCSSSASARWDAAASPPKTTEVQSAAGCQPPAAAASGAHGCQSPCGALPLQ